MTELAAVEKRPLRFLLDMGVYNLGINLVWISYNSILLPLMVQGTTSAATKGLWLGIISVVSILAGITANILSAVVSDHSQSGLGKRTPNILIGALLAAVVIGVSAAVPQTLPLVFAAYFLLQITGNVSVGAYQPLLADIVPENQRGLASGLQSAFTILGAAAGFVGVTSLVSAGKMEWALLAIAAVFVLTTVFNSIVIRREDRPLQRAEPLSLGKALPEMFRVQTRVPGFFWFVFANFLMYMGVSSFASYGIYYLDTVLRMPNPVAAMGVAGVVGITVNVVAAVAAGLASDRVGRKNLIVAAGVFSGLSCLLFPFLRNFGLFIAISALYGAANGVVYSVNQALACGLVPPDESGKYLGYNNLSIGLANAFAPLVFGVILNMRGAPTVTSFTVFFLVAAAFYWTSSVVFAMRVPKR